MLVGSSQLSKQGVQAGQSIIELLVSITVVAVVMTAIAIGLTISVRNTAQAKHRAYASVLGQQAMEVFRRERVLHGWPTFRGAIVGGEYCFNTLPASITELNNLAGECQTGVSSHGTEFKNDVEIITSDSSVHVRIVVSWTNGSRPSSIVLLQEFREYLDD